MSTPAPTKRIFLTLSMGDSPQSAKTVFVTENRAIVGAALSELGKLIEQAEARADARTPVQ